MTAVSAARGRRAPPRGGGWRRTIQGRWSPGAWAGPGAGHDQISDGRAPNAAATTMAAHPPADGSATAPSLAAAESPPATPRYEGQELSERERDSCWQLGMKEDDAQVRAPFPRLL